MMVSIIVPIYNAEKYIRKCIDSIMNQSLANIEIVLVNDGSTDNSLNICLEYQKKDNRVKVVDLKSNNGVVKAKKAGVRAATGKYIGWVDADDWIEKDYFEIMRKEMIEYKVDIVCANHFHDIGQDTTIIKNCFETGRYDLDEIIDKLLYSGNFFSFGIQPHLINKLMRKDIVDRLQENLDTRIIAGDDAAIVYPYLLCCRKIYVSDVCGYHYIQYRNSVSKQVNSDEYVRMNVLMDYLYENFKITKFEYTLKKQLNQYKKFYMLTRCIDKFDNNDIVLRPYGGINNGSKIIIYGAGVVGKRIFEYAYASKKYNIQLWVDRNYIKYRQDGFDVQDIGCISEIDEDDYDMMIIAVSDSHIAQIIRSLLVNELHIKKDKIRWFSEDFLQSNILDNKTDEGNRIKTSI